MSESRTERRTAGLDTPTGLRHGMWNRLRPNPDAFGQLTEGFARFMGTPQFLLWMSVFVFIWLGWNTFMPEDMQFDPRALNYTLLTLMLSLQASYARGGHPRLRPLRAARPVRGAARGAERA